MTELKVLILLSDFCFCFFTIVSHCNWKLRNDKERLFFLMFSFVVVADGTNFLSLPLFCQPTVRKTVFMATAWPPTPASVNRAGEGRTVLAVSPPAAAVCDK